MRSIRPFPPIRRSGMFPGVGILVHGCNSRFTNLTVQSATGNILFHMSLQTERLLAFHADSLRLAVQYLQTELDACSDGRVDVIRLDTKRFAAQ